MRRRRRAIRSAILAVAAVWVSSGWRCYACGALADRIEMLRTFRDTYLLSNPVGADLVKLYYTYSPAIADWIAHSAALRMVARSILWLVVGGLRTMSFAVVPITLFVLATIGWFARSFVRLRRMPTTRK